MTEQELREIEALIAEVEQGELLKAPGNMKKEIMEKCSRMPIPYSSRISLLAYSAKIGAGMAAALLLLFSVNMHRFAQLENVEAPKRTESVATQINQGLNDISSFINSFSNNLLSNGGEKDD